MPVLNLNSPVTFFVGENGSGKSTLLEGIATCAELPVIGSADVQSDPSLDAQRRLGQALRLAWSPRSRRGFFMRAEDFFGYLKSEARTDARILREKREADGAPAWPVQAEALGTVHIDEIEAVQHLQHRDRRSHGESFIETFTRRIQPAGLYLLDEPEAPLSIKRQIELARLLFTASNGGAQFIIVTHSPVLLSLPRARILSFDDVPIHEVAYDELENVKLARAFLLNPLPFLCDR